MNGTPITSKTHKNYTVLGRGPDSDRSTSSLSVLQLLRGRKYQRIEDIRKIASGNFFDVIILLPRNDALPYEELVSEYSNLRLMFFDPDYYERSSVGALINAGMAEAAGELVLVSWNGIEINLNEAALAQIRPETLCYVPCVRNSMGAIIPSLHVPAKTGTEGKNRFIEPVAIVPDGREQQSLFPHDYSGIYVKERFDRCGGFDDRMRNTYWQKLEFGCRAWLWGERIEYLAEFQLRYTEEGITEESTPDEDYLRFYLKVIAVSYTGDHAVLFMRQFRHYLRAGKRNIFGALRRFIREKRWVQRHAYNYRFDILHLVELWGENL